MVAHILLIIEAVTVGNLVLTSLIGLYHAVVATGYTWKSRCCGASIIELTNTPTPPPSVEGIPVSTRHLPAAKDVAKGFA
jgi:hypothetical protein